LTFGHSAATSRASPKLSSGPGMTMLQQTFDIIEECFFVQVRLLSDVAIKLEER
jgi:hypothetical protein